MRELLACFIHWDHLIALGTKHGILPLLIRHLTQPHQDFAGLVPDTITAKLQDAKSVLIRRSLRSLGVLAEIAKMLESHGIPMVLCKGPVLAQVAYGNIAMRHFADLDILVPQDQWEEAVTVLCSNGYRLASGKFHGDYREAQKCGRKDISLISDQWGFRLELHHTLTTLAAPIPLTYHHVRPGLTSVRITNLEFLSLGPNDLIVYLCIHGTSHMWGRLEWVCCIAELIRQYSDTAWDGVMDCARALKAERAVLSGLYLAKLTFPDIQLSQKIPQDVKVGWQLAQIARQRIFEQREPLADARAVYTYRLKASRPVDHLRTLWLLVRDVTPAELKIVRLPRSLFPVYYGIRLVRLVWRHGKSRFIVGTEDPGTL